MLWMYQRVFFGPLDNPDNENLADMNSRELTYVVPLIVLCFWIGLYPKPIFEFLEKPVNYIASIVDSEYAEALAQMEEAESTLESRAALVEE